MAQEAEVVINGQTDLASENDLRRLDVGRVNFRGFKEHELIVLIYSLPS